MKGTWVVDEIAVVLDDCWRSIYTVIRGLGVGFVVRTLRRYGFIEGLPAQRFVCTTFCPLL